MCRVPRRRLQLYGVLLFFFFIHNKRRLTTDEFSLRGNPFATNAILGNGGLYDRAVGTVLGMRTEEKFALPYPAIRDDNFTIADFQLVELLGHGGHNIVFLVEGTPEFYKEHGLTTASDRRLVLKLGYSKLKYSDSQQIELESLSRMHSNITRAKEVGALPLYSYLPEVLNPFDCPRNSTDSDRRIPKLPEFSLQTWTLICKATTMTVMVSPYKKPEFLFDRQRTMDEYITFLRSLLEQLNLAHSYMVSNNDLNPEKNIFVDEITGGAVLFDWNFGMVYPHLMFPDNASVRYNTPCSLNPPEGLARQIYKYGTEYYSIYANDIWQVGKIFSNILYRPCVWACEILDEQDVNKTLPEIILSLGGNTVIPVNATHEVDLAEILELPVDIGNTTTFHPILQQGWGPVSECPINSSWYLDDPEISKEKKSQAIDLLRKMLSLSPYDRPPSAALLEHPFLN